MLFKGLYFVWSLLADNYDYVDDNSNLNKACGFNIVLIALTMAMNGDNIVLC